MRLSIFMLVRAKTHLLQPLFCYKFTRRIALRGFITKPFSIKYYSLSDEFLVVVFNQILSKM